MSRLRWWVVLAASLLAMVAGGAGILTPGSELDPAESDVGTIGPVRAESVTQPAPSRAGATSRVPEITRRPASLDVDTQSEVVAPTQLRVASVGLRAPVDAVGVRADGLMQIPDDGSRVGWYRHGPAAGDAVGSVVLAGHVDTDEGLGVMAALREVPLKSRVEVELADGSVVAYEVVGRRTVPKDDLALGELFDRDGSARLTLITCGGPWRPDAASYRDNVVVVARPLVQG